jgi:hypothetical protein
MIAGAMSRRSFAVLPVLAGLVLAVAPALAASTPAPIHGSSGPLSVTLVPPSTHAPKVGVKLPISVTAKLAGKPAHATAEYQFLLGGAVVGTSYPSGKRPTPFTGHYNDNLIFPASAVGEPLTFRVVISAGGHTVKLSFAIDARM